MKGATARRLARLIGLAALIASTSIAGANAAPRVPTLAATDTVTLVTTSDIHYGRSTAADGFGREDAQLALALDPDYVVPVGDWIDGPESPTQYTDKVDPDWGLLKSRFRPTIGNHEYEYTTDYDTYFPPSQRTWGSGNAKTEDYWSWETANGWHVVSLNFNLSDSAGSAQYTWLAADLAAHRGEPTIVFEHGPRYSDGLRGDQSGEAATWALAMEQKADLFVSGNDHGYQRWERLNNSKQADPNGIRQLIVGVGGYGDNSVYGLPTDSYPLREFGTVAYHGVVKLTLHVNSYDIEFLRVPSEGGGIVDAVYNQPVLNLRSVEPDTTPPTTPGGLEAMPMAQDRIDLTWDASTDDVAVTGYEVYRDGVAISSVGGQALAYTDAGLQPATTYSYAVDAFDAAGNHSPPTTAVTATTPPLDTVPPSVPTGLTATAAGATSINLAWNSSTDDSAVAGYTVYRNGTAVGRPVSPGLMDTGLAPGTTYSYTVDAYDRAGNHSAQSSAATATTAARAITFVQASSMSSGARRTSIAVSLTKPVAAGDLLTGMFTQWDAAGQVQVSDNVNGAWTRAQSITYSTGRGDIALYYVAGTAGSPSGLVITVSAAASTYLYGSVGEYGAVASTSPLEAAVLRSGSGTAVDSGPTGITGAGELVFASLTGNNNPGTVTPGSSQGIPFTMRSAYGSISDADIVSSNQGAQSARFSIANAVTWYVAVAVFKPAVAVVDTIPPTVPAGLSAVASAPSTVDLAWVGSTDNVAVAGYTVYRNGTAIGNAGPSARAYTDKTASSATAYAYTIDAFDGAGNHSSQSAAASLTTPDWTSPSTPDGLQATAVSATEIDLGWQASTDNVGVVGYTVYRDSSPLATIGPILAYADTGLVPGSSHTYTVVAFDAAGNHSAMSQPASATTSSPPDTSPPGVPSGLSVQVARAGEVDLTWSASLDDVGVAGYVVYRDGSAIGTTSGSGTAYADVTVASVTSYSYAVDAFDAAGNHSQRSTSVSITTPDWAPPSTPAQVSAIASASSVAVSWAASTDDVGVAGYDVYRDGTLLASAGGSVLSYTDAEVKPGTTYSYSLDAYDAAGNHSPPSQALSVTVPAPPDTSPPTVPAGLTATVVGTASVRLGWSASTDDVGVAGYTVYRNGTALISVSGSTLTYSDGGLAAGTTYTYTVEAFDAAGNRSAPSLPAAATTLPAANARFVQAATSTTGTKVLSVRLLLGPVTAGDLLVGWFAQWNSSGQVHVWDPLNGTWTRGNSTTYSNGKGDIALFYVVNAKAAPAGLAVTVTADSATYLAGTASEYGDVSVASRLEAAAIGAGNGTSAWSGTAPAANGGELVYAAVTTNNSPGTVTAVAPFSLRSRYDTCAEADVTSAVPGPQRAGFNFTSSTRWYAIVAVFLVA